MTIANLLAQYQHPENLNHAEHYANIRTLNESLMDQIRTALTEKLPLNGNNFAYATTGSDGRLEKSIMSKIELMLIHKDPLSDDQSLERIETAINSESPDMIHEHKETKNLGDPNQKTSGYNGNPARLYPTRLLDAIAIYGNPETLSEAKNLLSEEIKTPFGKKVLKQVKAQKKNSADTTRTGVTVFKRQRTRQFDLNAGVSFYGEESNGTYPATSFKQGPLRLVQYALAEDFVKRTRNQKERDPPTPEMPTNIVERLFYLQSENLTNLSLSETETLADCYQYFIWQYHKSQENFRLNGQAETEFEKAEVKERLEELTNLAEGKRVLNGATSNLQRTRKFR